MHKSILRIFFIIYIIFFVSHIKYDSILLADLLVSVKLLSRIRTLVCEYIGSKIIVFPQ